MAVIINGKYHVDLQGPDGNVFMVLGLVKSVCDQTGEDFKKISKAMMEGNYYHALGVVEKYLSDYIVFENDPRKPHEG